MRLAYGQKYGIAWDHQVGAAIPISLQTKHDRALDSPQVRDCLGSLGTGWLIVIASVYKHDTLFASELQATKD